MINEQKVEIPIEAQKKLVNEILKDISAFCDEKGIIYYLAYGTLLGAVRHKGFIPWDDDIDIMMTRQEFTRFKNEYNNRHSKFKLLCFDIEDRFDSPLPKVIDTNTILVQTEVYEQMQLGLYVDIFILDNIPDDEKRRRRFLWNLSFLQKCWAFIRYKRRYPKYSPLFYIYKIAKRVFKPMFFVKIIDKYSQKYNFENTQCFGNINHCANRFKYIYNKTWFEEGTTVTFERNIYRAPKEWDAFLSCLYGNYMELPPIEKRVSEHIHSVYYK